MAARPSYPGEAIDRCLLGLGEPATVSVVDVGAGTGISSVLFAERGCSVIAAEPKGEMRAAGEWLPWKRVTRVAEHVHFSHRRHVSAGSILCETCHGDVPARDVPFSRPFINFRGETGMQRCIACHHASGNPRAKVDCALCHR